MKRLMAGLLFAAGMLFPLSPSVFAASPSEEFLSILEQSMALPGAYTSDIHMHVEKGMIPASITLRAKASGSIVGDDAQSEIHLSVDVSDITDGLLPPSFQGLSELHAEMTAEMRVIASEQVFYYLLKDSAFSSNHKEVDALGKAYAEFLKFIEGKYMKLDLHSFTLLLKEIDPYNSDLADLEAFRIHPSGVYQAAARDLYAGFIRLGLVLVSEPEPGLYELRLATSVDQHQVNGVRDLIQAYFVRIYGEAYAQSFDWESVSLPVSDINTFLGFLAGVKPVVTVTARDNKIQEIQSQFSFGSFISGSLSFSATMSYQGLGLIEKPSSDETLDITTIVKGFASASSFFGEPGGISPFDEQSYEEDYGYDSSLEPASPFEYPSRYEEQVLGGDAAALVDLVFEECAGDQNTSVNSGCMRDLLAHFDLLPSEAKAVKREVFRRLQYEAIWRRESVWKE